MGNDVFVFAGTLNATTNRDVIIDFANMVGNNDALQLIFAVFIKLGLATGAMIAASFKRSTQL